MPALTDETKAQRLADKPLQIAMGQRMRWARQLANINQSDFAKLLGVTKPDINKVESGVQAPNAHILRSYANRLKVTSDYLLFGRLQAEQMPIKKQMRLMADHPELFALQDGMDSNH